LSKENQNIIDNGLIFGIALAGALGIISQFAFSQASRKKILERDGYRSVWSGDTERLHVAHSNHTKDSTYDDPSRGRTLTVLEHYVDHYNRHGSSELGLTMAQNIYGLRKLYGMLTDEEKRAVLPPESLTEPDNSYLKMEYA